MDLSDKIPKEEREILYKIFKDVFNACFAHKLFDCENYGQIRRIIFNHTDEIADYLDLEIVDEYEQSKQDQRIDELCRGENSGLFLIPLKGAAKIALFCMVSDGDGWEHVSVSIKQSKTLREVGRVPNWAEMCKTKSLFWDPDDCVVQFHPPESEYICDHNYVLHLWRKTAENWETPPSIMVGINNGQKI